MDTIHNVFSYGGGVQSTAALVLAAQGRIDFPCFVFANVGEDSENPETLTFVHERAMPYAERHGIELVELFKKRKGKTETLYQRIYSTDRSIPIPARLQTGAPGNRTCTTDFKVHVIDRWLKSQGRLRVQIGLGISIDEIHRAHTSEWELTDNKIWKRKAYPLIDLRLSRRQCETIIREAGLPVPPKSSCYFCPYHSQPEWLRLKQMRPDLFNKAVAIEEKLKSKRRDLGHDTIWLHSSLQPLAQAVGNQMLLPFDETCESGYCMT